MEDITTPNEPLNPYARVFFGLWGLIALLLTGLQTSNSISEQIEPPPSAGITNRLAEKSLERDRNSHNPTITLSIGKTPTPYPLSTAIQRGEKR